MVRYLYDDFVKTPQTGEEWVKKFKSFMENYEFPFVGALGGLHAHVLTHLKNHFNLKKQIYYHKHWANRTQQAFSPFNWDTWNYS